jgi:hypothetical protein
MPITRMRSDLPDEIKTIAGESGDEFSGSYCMKATVVNGHVLDGNGDAGLLPGNLLDLDGILWAFR